MKERLIIVGNGMAGMKALEELLMREPDKYDITVFGDEPHVNYNRIMLSPVLAGEKCFEDIIINDRKWYEDSNITLYTSEKIIGIRRSEKIVVSEKGRELPYDVLWLATGSKPILLPLPGNDLPGVLTFRDMSDVNQMLAASKEYSDAVVIGGGLLGLEAAHGLNLNGMNVTILHKADWLMERQLDESAGYLLKRELEERGMKIFIGADTKSILGNGRVESVKLADGTEIKADLVVMAVGIYPNTELAKKAELECGRGIKVSDTLQTSDPSIYAIGECAEHRGVTYGLVSPLYEMGRVLAANMSGAENKYKGSVTFTKLKVSGVDVFSAGSIEEGPEVEDLVFRDAREGRYKRLIVSEGKLVGAVLYGDVDDGPWYFQLIKDRNKIDDIREHIIFGQSLAVGADSTDPLAAVSALADNAEICGCNGVCKGEIVNSIKKNGLSSVEDVRSYTKASASCGSCTGLVQQILKVTLGDSFEAPESTPLCGCTDYSHEDVRRLILLKELKVIPQVMQELEWKTPNGCSKCRPALNFYLLCAFPGEYIDDNQSRFINERVHANIQKDGTYSVVPRMWGGLTTAKQLRAIADVVEKFNIPTVKITGGQRIDMLGVKKEDLPAVWKDLNDAGMVSGHAYGKALRTVKTCVGSEWCRFGTQASMSMGVDLEKLTWGSWMPHKFKMAVSGCPRNCAESTIKDFGIVAVDSGWEIYVGGNGGMKVRASDFLCKAETKEEVEEYCQAFIQLYREEAHYLERTAPWIERVGLQHIIDQIVNDKDKREQLAGKFRFSQQFVQKDPWKERASGGVDTHEYNALAKIG